MAGRPATSGWPSLRTPARTARGLLVGLGMVVAVAGCDAVLPLGPPTPAAVPSVATPPTAVLSTPEGARKLGELGSYTYLGAGTDTPWLPAGALDPFAVPGGEPLAVQLQGDVAASSATAAVAAAADPQAVESRPVTLVGPLAMGGFEIPPQPIGSWVLVVDLVYGDGSGSGAYYWHLDVQ